MGLFISEDEGQRLPSLAVANAQDVLLEDAARVRAAKLFDIVLENVTFEGSMVTRVEVHGPDCSGLLACLVARIASLGCDVVGADSEGVAPELTETRVLDVFYITTQNAPIARVDHEALRNALRATCSTVISATAKPRDKYLVTLSPDKERNATHIAVHGPDAPGLLNALTTTLTAAHCSILTFSGETTAHGEAETTFVVQQEGAPLEKAAETPIQARLKDACGTILGALDNSQSMSQHSKSIGGAPAAAVSHYQVAVTNTIDEHSSAGLLTKVRVIGPDVPGLLNQLASALSADGYSIAGFTLGKGGGPKAAPPPDSSLPQDSFRSAASSKTGDVDDVFRISRDGKPLGEEECAYLRTWLSERCEAAVAEWEKAEIVNRAAHSAMSPAAASPSATKPAKAGRGLFGRLFGRRNTSGHSTPDSTPRGQAGPHGTPKSGRAPAATLTAAERRHLAAVLGDEAEVPAMVRRALIDPSELELGSTIGSGSAGEVIAGNYHGTPVAVKRMHRKMLSPEFLELFVEECELCLSLRHPNIVQLLGGSWRLDSPDVCMVMERCNGTLHDALMAQDTPLPMAIRHTVLVGVARAMSYLHAQSPPILHRDLKPENVLLMDDFQPKLSDFGSSREAAALSSTMIGTPLFTAPEVLSQQAYGLSCDVWSYGCIIACLLMRSQYPYPKELLAGVNFATLSASVRSGTLVPGLPQRTSSPLAAIGWRCCQLNPADRVSFAQVTEELQQKQTAAWAAQAAEANP